MPRSATGSKASSTPKPSSTAGSADVVEAGPVTKNGIVYFKVRRCPLCRLLNTDENPIKSGGLSTNGTVPWHQGSSTNPIGRICRICFVVFTQAGFSEQLESLSNFLEVRKEQRCLMEEWLAAYNHVVNLGEELPERMGKVFAQGHELIRSLCFCDPI